MSDQEMVSDIVKDLIARLESCGVYVVPGMVAVNVNANDDVLRDLESGDEDLRTMVAIGNAVVNIQIVASTGDLALSDEFLFPDKFKEQKDFLSIAPLESEMTIAQMLEEYEQMINDHDEDL